MVEQSAVNRWVEGSSPSSGAIISPSRSIPFAVFVFELLFESLCEVPLEAQIRVLLRITDDAPIDSRLFQAAKTESIPALEATGDHP